MATLPSDKDLGGIPSPSSSRPIASVDTSGYSRGAAAQAEGTRALGAGIQRAGAEVESVAAHQQAEAYATAQADMLTKTVELETEFLNDTDYATRTQRYQERMDKIRTEAGATLTGPARKRFESQASLHTARAIHNQTQQAQTQGNDASLAHLGEEGQWLIKNAIAVNTEDAKIAAIDGFNSRVDALVARKVLTQQKALQIKQTWARQYKQSDAEARIDRGDMSVIDEIRKARDTVPPYPGAGGYTEKQQEQIRGVANVAKRGDVWGNPDAPDFAEKHLTTVATDSGKKITANKVAAEAFRGFLNELEGMGYRVDSLGSYANRKIFGTNYDSQHKFGNAIDINPGRNPVTRGEGVQTDLPPNVGEIAAKYGLSWGGDWKGSKKDPMHFEFAGVQPVRVAQAGGTATDATPSAAPQSVYSILRSDQIDALLLRAEKAKARFSHERAEKYEGTIIDAGAGKASLFDRSVIENDPLLSTTHRNALKRQYDAAAGDVAGTQRFINRLYGNDPGISAVDGRPTVPFNPYDKDEQKYADAAFQQIGGDGTALQVIVGKTGIVPKSAALMLRSDINSTDPNRVASSLTVASNMLSANQNVFASVESKKEFEDGAVTFRHYVDDLGMTAQEAAQKIIEQRAPEYQAQKNARIKTENVDEKLKKETSINDLRSQFDPSAFGWMQNPQVDFAPKGRAELYAQYAEQVKENYLQTGDWSLAKKLAGNTVKRAWGVTNVNGSAGITGGGVVMMYPPERAPAYAGIENVSEKFAQHAIETIKTETGKDVKRESLRIAPIPRVTAAQYKSGEPPQYFLSWQDENGNVQTINPDSRKAFWVDPAALRQAQQAKREPALDRAAKIADLRRIDEEVTPPTLRERGF
jgi:hypothetical protein